MTLRPPPNPAVVVMGYDRPDSLSQLLASLDRASIPEGTPLVVSIDGGGRRGDEVVDRARRHRWSHGDSEVVTHDHLGLVDHFHRCGDLTARFGSIVLLEDDLVVGPAFHQWATAALTAAEPDERIAGVCLSAPWFDGYRHLPFEPVLDGSDGFYAQLPWFHGLAWTTRMWRGYRDWTAAPTDTPIHAAFDQLDTDEWFPGAVRHLVSTGRHHLLPRWPHATNTGAAGQHFDVGSDVFQVPVVQTDRLGEVRITPLDDALAVYDDHMELLPDRLARLCPDLADADLTVDLLGVRDLGRVTTSHVLTTRPVRRAERTWGTSRRPLAMNLVGDEVGVGISLARTVDVRTDQVADRVTRHRLAAHAAHDRPPGPRSILRSTADRLVARLDGIRRDR